MEFRAGDTAVCIQKEGYLLISVNKEYQVRSVERDTISLVGNTYHYPSRLFRKAEPELEQELKLCESRKDILEGHIAQHQEEKKSLEKRIQALQQAIKERDKPKGRVGLKDPLDTEGPMYAVAGDGVIFTPTFARDKKEYRALGNLFYDKESAERAVHDRKQRVLRGEYI